VPIPDRQISRWSEQADSTLPGWTHAVLHDALDDAKLLEELGVEIFVQGSYANSTNVRKDSDVDLVVQLKLPLEEDVDGLNPDEVELFYQHYGYTDYGWEEFREDVVRSLREKFFVREGNKCIDITDMDSLLRVPADILPAIEFRRYRAFPSLAGEVYEEGVFFRDAAGHAIVNFPKQHLANGKAKDWATGGRFKQVIRVFKNARRHETAGIEKENAPSYFLECLLYNVPNATFWAPLSDAYRSCLTWLTTNRGKFDGFQCQNGLVKLFGDAPDRWSTVAAEGLLRVLSDQWDTWQ
jgi:hypothetical protein